MLDRRPFPTAVRRSAVTLVTILTSCAGLGVTAPTANAMNAMNATNLVSRVNPANPADSTNPTGRADVSDVPSIDDCGSLTLSGSAFGYLDNGTLSAGFCVGLKSIRRINIAYDKTGGGATTVRLGYQQTNSTGVGIGKPVYGSALTATSGNTVLRSLYPVLPPGCYHGVMLNTATRYQYVTKVWGEC